MSAHSTATLPVPGAHAAGAPGWRQWLLAVTNALGLRRATADDAAVTEVARQLASVRALADRYRRCDPGFASDLYAAADRYEQSFEHKHH